MTGLLGRKKANYMIGQAGLLLKINIVRTKANRFIKSFSFIMSPLSEIPEHKISEIEISE